VDGSSRAGPRVECGTGTCAVGVLVLVSEARDVEENLWRIQFMLRRRRRVASAQEINLRNRSQLTTGPEVNPSSFGCCGCRRIVWSAAVLASCSSRRMPRMRSGKVFAARPSRPVYKTQRVDPRRRRSRRSGAVGAGRQGMSQDHHHFTTTQQRRCDATMSTTCTD
jgi:hypothetical protein